MPAAAAHAMVKTPAPHHAERCPSSLHNNGWSNNAQVNSNEHQNTYWKSCAESDLYQPKEELCRRSLLWRLSVVAGTGGTQADM
jgi:hypothetical protein